MSNQELTIRPKKLKEYEKLWLQRFGELIQSKMGNYNLTSYDMSSEMLVSRIQLFRKIKNLTGLTPMKYVKRARLINALTLINQNSCRSIKEVAHKVGFKDEKYFSRQFKSFFGKSPSTYIKEGCL